MASYTDTSGLEAPSQSHPRYDHPWLSDLAGNPNQDGDSWLDTTLQPASTTTDFVSNGPDDQPVQLLPYEQVAPLGKWPEPPGLGTTSSYATDNVPLTLSEQLAFNEWVNPDPNDDTLSFHPYPAPSHSQEDSGNQYLSGETLSQPVYPIRFKIPLTDDPGIRAPSEGRKASKSSGSRKTSVSSRSKQVAKPSRSSQISRRSALSGSHPDSVPSTLPSSRKSSKRKLSSCTADSREPKVLYFPSSSILPRIPSSAITVAMDHFLDHCPGWIPVIDETTVVTISSLGAYDLFPDDLFISRHLCETATSFNHLEKEYTTMDGEKIILSLDIGAPKLFLDFVQIHVEYFWSVCENEAHAILFPLPNTQSEDRPSELQDDMEAEEVLHAARQMLRKQRFLHAFEDESEIPLMYQSRAVKAWLKKTFYSGLYGLTHRLPWKEEVPAASFVAANSFFCLILHQYEATGVRDPSRTLKAVASSYKQHYTRFHQGVCFLEKCLASGPIFREYQKAIAPELAPPTGMQIYPESSSSQSSLLGAVFYPRPGDLPEKSDGVHTLVASSY